MISIFVFLWGNFFGLLVVFNCEYVMKYMVFLWFNVRCVDYEYEEEKFVVGINKILYKIVCD